jgi:hypothetical protein
MEKMKNLPEGWKERKNLPERRRIFLKLFLGNMDGILIYYLATIVSGSCLFETLWCYLSILPES